MDVHLDHRSGLKVIFLDIDGVLHSQSVAPQMGPVQPDKEDDDNDETFADDNGNVQDMDTSTAADLFHPACMHELQRLLAGAGPDAVVVLSSSWRLDPPWMEEATSRLAKWGITILSCTPSSDVEGAAGPQRANEIVAWLRERPGHVQTFVILDDLDLSNDALGADRFVHVDGDVGLQERDVDAALRILLPPQQHEQELDQERSEGSCPESVASFVDNYDRWLAGLVSSGKPWWWDRACKHEKKEKKKEKKHKKSKRSTKDKEGDSD